MHVIPLSGLVLAAVLGAASAKGAAHGSNKYLHLVNRAHDSLVSLSVAPHGDKPLRIVTFGRGLQGGGSSTTVAITDGQCRFDLHFTFIDGRSIDYRDFDICRNSRLRVHRLPPRSEEAATSYTVAFGNPHSDY